MAAPRRGQTRRKNVLPLTKRPNKLNLRTKIFVHFRPNLPTPFGSPLTERNRLSQNWAGCVCVWGGGGGGVRGVEGVVNYCSVVTCCSYKH